MASGAAALLLLGSGVLLASVADGTILTYAFGSWRPPFGIVFVADRLSALFVAVQSLLVLVTVLLLPPETRGARHAERALPLVFLLSMALTGGFLTGDLFDLFVMFELVLMLSYLLLQVPGSPRARQVTFPLVVVNLLASTSFFVGTGLLYRLAGSVNLAHLSLAAIEGHARLRVVALGLLVLAFAVKSALVPLSFWLPASYPVLSGPVAALFAGMMTKLGVYALFRTVPLLMGDTALPGLLVVGGAVSALLAVLAAFAQHRLRRLLGYHVISQVGYMLFGVGLMTAAGLAGALYFTLHNILVKSTLFYVADELELHAGSQSLRDMHPSHLSGASLAACFLAAGLSIAGMPPLSGFFGKLAVFRAALEAGATVSLALLVLASLFTLASMVKIWGHAFQRRPSEAPGGGGARAHWPLVGLAGVSLGIALGVGPVWGYATATATQLLDRSRYVGAVAATPGRPAPDVFEEAP